MTYKAISKLQIWKEKNTKHEQNHISSEILSLFVALLPLSLLISWIQLQKPYYP